MATGYNIAVIKHLRKLNGKLKTEVAELTTKVGRLMDGYLETRNEVDRSEDKLKKVNDVNKTLVAMFHAGKGKRTKGKGFMTIAIEVENEDMGVKLALESLHVFIN